MTKEKFNEINDLFNSLVSDNDLSETMYVVDSKSILERVYYKIGNKIDENLIAGFLLYKTHILNEQYESANKMREYIYNIK